MDIRKLQRAIVDGLEDVKAQNIVVFNTEHLSALFERVIIASGTSNRQTKSLASSVREAVKEAGFPVLRTEGEVNGEWIIVDCGAAVVHVMQPSIRDYYHLEEIWGDKPVKIKLDGGSTRLVKAEDSAAPVAKKTTAKKVVAKKVAAKKVATPRSVGSKAVASKKAAPRRAVAGGAVARPGGAAAAKKLAPRAGVSRTTGVKSAPARTIVVNAPVARKTAGKAVAAKKVIAKKVVAAKTAAKKATARKSA